MALTYHEQSDIRNNEKLNNLLEELPQFVRLYFRGKAESTTSRTQLSYAYDIRKFFSWMKAANPQLHTKQLCDITLAEFGGINGFDIEEYMAYLKSSEETLNRNAGIARKISALSSLYTYLFKKNMVDGNPCEQAEKPKKLKDERMVKLQPNEIPELLDAIEFGHPSFSAGQQKRLENSRLRDLAIATLLLGTGIRVSECVGLNIENIDFDGCRITVMRKGGKIAYVAIGDEVITALSNYMNQRLKQTVTDKQNKNALFLSSQGRRICVQSVENMIEKYTEAIGTKEHITPHKLRKTYGTELYNQTGDIYLVARALGHNNVNTTKDHYVDGNNDDLLNARNIVKMRK